MKIRLISRGSPWSIRRWRSAVGLLLLPALIAACVASPAQPLPSATPSPTPVAVPLAGTSDDPILALTGGTLIDGTGAPPMPNAVVMIRGNRVVAVGPRTDVAIPAGARVVDVSGATILPGFINVHVHRGYTEANLRAWAQAGVTTVRDLGVSPWEDAFVRRDALLADPANARLVAAGPIVTVPGGYPMVPWGMAGLAIASPEDAISQTDRLLDGGADIIKIALDSGGTFGRQIPILSPPEAAAIVRTAHARGARVSAHVLQSADLARALDARVDDIAHMVEDELPDALIGSMVAAGTYWVPTLELWQRVGLSGKQPVTNLRRFVAAGGLVALGTDYAGYAAEFDLGMPVTEIELMAEAGMTPMQIIGAATKNAAIVCGLDGKLGTLERGKLADVLVVDGDPLTDIHALTQARLVLREGVTIRQKAAPTAHTSDAGNDAPLAETLDQSMAAIPAGEFIMGSDTGRNDERPAHTVYLDAYELDRFEVTNAQYRRFLLATGRPSPRYWTGTAYPSGQPDCPVVGVSWDDADAYCRWAGKRLPTEAEWEKACRGTDGQLYPWGEAGEPARANVARVDQSSGGAAQDAMALTVWDAAWARQALPPEASGPALQPVGLHLDGASPYGILDMVGTASEWVADWHNWSDYSRLPARNPVVMGPPWNHSLAMPDCGREQERACELQPEAD